MGRFNDKLLDLFINIKIDSHILRTKLTNVEDRRRFLFDRSGSEISRHGKPLSPALELGDDIGWGCGGTSKLAFACQITSLD